MENLHLAPDDADENDDLYSGYDYQSIANVRECVLVSWVKEVKPKVLHIEIGQPVFTVCVCT